ncbi:hypothetical protein [Polyangium jinanense]|uniref:Lipoprotein n=1 Tax=Polyangium jinanense TaxID=2829994 RepID=A0A9X4ASY7_9BACT|nr:hypothetical protein [Polyangium jinanense]MDC3958172.1 hypothetical protein [Polyangium jinanense]MDC3983629.1 hypothetical protein [Polyangium jinanense]
MRAFLVATLFLAGFSLSCASADDGSIRPEPPAETPNALAPLPQEFAQLGKPCPPPDQKTDYAAPYAGCGKDGHVGIVTVGRHTGLPEGAQKLEGSMGKVQVLIESERVWVQGTCVWCRNLTEQTSVVHLAYATDEQLMQIQMQAELTNKSPLRDAEAWRAAVAAWEPRK